MHLYSIWLFDFVFTALQYCLFMAFRGAKKKFSRSCLSMNRVYMSSSFFPFVPVIPIKWLMP